MKALTLWRPWPIAMFFLRYELQKDVENRGWKPPDSIIGQRIAIHAGSKYVDVFAQWLDIIKPSPSETFELLAYWEQKSEVRGIIGTTVVAGWSRISNSRWAEKGLIHWSMMDRRPLPKPIPCKGAQGLWTVPPDIERQIEDMTMEEFEKGIIDIERAER